MILIAAVLILAAIAFLGIYQRNIPFTAIGWPRIDEVVIPETIIIEPEKVIEKAKDGVNE